MNSIELLFDYFEDHVKADAAVAERKPLAFGILCFLIGGLSLFVSQALADRLTLFSFSWASCGLALIWKISAGFVLAAVVHQILEMGGKTGSAAALFVLFGMADLAWALAVPLLLLARAFASGSSWLVTGIFLAVGFFVLVLKVRGIQDNYRVTAGRAWVSLGLPYVAVAATTVLALSLAVAELVMKVLSSR
jgi:hypothetical protein